MITSDYNNLKSWYNFSFANYSRTCHEYWKYRTIL